MSGLNLDTDTAELERLISEKKEVEAEETADPGEVVETGEINDDVYAALEAKGVSRADIASAKDKFGEIFVFPWSDDRIYVFRGLYRKEYNRIREAAATEADFEFFLIRQGCLYPRFESLSLLEEEMAGIQDVLSQLILRASGFIAIEQALATLREL